MTGLEVALLVVGSVSMAVVSGLLVVSVQSERRARQPSGPHPATRELALLVRSTTPSEPETSALVDDLAGAVFEGVLVRDLLTAHGGRVTRGAVPDDPDLAELARSVAGRATWAEGSGGDAPEPRE